MRRRSQFLAHSYWEQIRPNEESTVFPYSDSFLESPGNFADIKPYLESKFKGWYYKSFQKACWFCFSEWNFYLNFRDNEI